MIYNIYLYIYIILCIIADCRQPTDAIDANGPGIWLHNLQKNVPSDCEEWGQSNQREDDEEDSYPFMIILLNIDHTRC